jgi:hypothetical protein
MYPESQIDFLNKKIKKFRLDYIEPTHNGPVLDTKGCGILTNN